MEALLSPSSATCNLCFWQARRTLGVEHSLSSLFKCKHADTRANTDHVDNFSVQSCVCAYSIIMFSGIFNHLSFFLDNYIFSPNWFLCYPSSCSQAFSVTYDIYIYSVSIHSYINPWIYKKRMFLVNRHGSLHQPSDFHNWPLHSGHSTGTKLHQQHLQPLENIHTSYNHYY